MSRALAIISSVAPALLNAMTAFRGKVAPPIRTSAGSGGPPSSRQAGALEKALRDAIDRRQPDPVILDPFVKLHALEENDNAAMDFVCDLLAKLAGPVHHEEERGGRGQP
jgi:hypothetical protein